jgi:hypothetical protein
MLQSQQVWLPVLHEPVKFENMGKWKSENGINLIAHCEEGVKSGLRHLHISTSPHSSFAWPRVISDEISGLKGRIQPVTDNTV